MNLQNSNFEQSFNKPQNHQPSTQQPTNQSPSNQQYSNHSHPNQQPPTDFSNVYSNSRYVNSQYPNVFKNATIPKPMKYVHNNYRLVIRSEDRDRTIYRNPNEYKVRLPRRYRNISAIECGLIMLPNFSNSEKYFTLEIQEICDGPYDSLDPDISKCLALIPNSLALNNYNYILSVPGDTSFVKNYIKKFIDTPLASLETLTIKFKKENKNVINFGKDLLPYDREFSFTLSGLDNEFDALTVNQGADTLTIKSPDHGLVKDGDGGEDSIFIYDVQVKYLDSITNRYIVKYVNLLNTIILGSDITPFEPTDDNFKINVSEDLKNELSPLADNSGDEDYYPNLVLTGKWKRVYRSDGNYSRLKLVNIPQIDLTDDLVTLSCLNLQKHHLNKNDRIYISHPTITNSTLYNNYHIVISTLDNPNIPNVLSESKFQLSVSNIKISDILNEDNADAMNDITQNPSLPNEVVLEDDDNLPSTKIEDGEIDGGFMQRYGNPDPSIQNILIFNITTRDEDSEHVMSENISYGNLYETKR